MQQVNVRTDRRNYCREKKIDFENTASDLD